MARPLRIAVAGATGALGRAVVDALADHALPAGALRLLASARSAGAAIPYGGEDLEVEVAAEGCFRGCDLAILAVPAETARALAPQARAEGCLAVDASAAFRDDPEVPLVVPEVNADAADLLPRGLAASPCGLGAALPLVLEPLRAAAGLTRVSVVGVEAVSGAGRPAIDQLEVEAKALMNGREPPPPSALPHRIAFNLLPCAGAVLPGGGSEEEARLAGAVRRVLGAPDLPVAVTVIQAPLFYGHVAAVAVETGSRLGAVEARELLRRAEGLKLLDAPAKGVYPMPMLGVNDDAVLVGRVRGDASRENGLELVLSVDNLRKGGATNLVQIAMLLAGRHLRRE
ncbi:MAG TPA: aspartate-semialdehyde dehydrogenase [Anaeromyxobacteraceae bacterium]|jgi:aspartate-semialdehyde dehydrogenase